MNWAALRDLKLSQGSPLVKETSQVVSGVASPGQPYSWVRISEVSRNIHIHSVIVFMYVPVWMQCVCGDVYANIYPDKT
jgi:hypothetical protein